MAISSDIEKLERRWMDNPTGLMFAPLAEAYRKAGNTGRALEILESGLGQHPDYVPALIVRGRCHLDAGHLVPAEAAFQQALDRDPVNAIALRGMADLYERSGRIRLAVERLEVLLEVERGDPEARQALARLRRIRETHGDEIAPLGQFADEPSVPPPSTTAFEEPTSVFDVTVVEAKEWTEAEPVAEPDPVSDEESSPEEPAASVDAEERVEPEAAVRFSPEEASDITEDLSELEARAAEIDLAEVMDSDRSGVEGIVNESVGAAEDLAEAAESRMDRPDERPESFGFGESWAMWAAWQTRASPPFEEDAVVPAGAEPDVSDRPEESSIPESVEQPAAVEEISAPPGDERSSAPEGLIESEPEARVGTEWSGEEESMEDEEVPIESLEIDEPEEVVASLDEREEEESEPEPTAAAPLEPGMAVEPASATGPEPVPPPAPELEPVAEPEPELVVTESMAELFLKQGHSDLALAVYRQLLEREPESESVPAAIQRLTREAATPETVGRHAARETGGESVEQFLRAVLDAPPPPVVSSVLPPAIEPQGEPTHPAGEPLALSAVFGSRPPVSPPIAGAEVPAPPVPQDEEAEPSYDEFFESPSPAEPEPAAAQSDPRPSDAEDLRQFNEWLKGLKR